MKEELLRLNLIGKLVSFNQYLKARALRKKDGRYIAMMYASSEYTTLVNSLILRLKQVWKKEPLTEYVDMILKTSRWKLADTGNIEKPISDSLEKAGVLKNDNLIRHIFILRDYHSKGEDDLLEIILLPILTNKRIGKIIIKELSDN